MSPWRCDNLSMIALDTNILARFYVEDPDDTEAARQRPLARAIIFDGRPLFVPLTVILELEWVLRAFYDFKVAEIVRVMDHLLGLPNLFVEDASRVATAVRVIHPQRVCEQPIGQRVGGVEPSQHGAHALQHRRGIKALQPKPRQRPRVPLGQAQRLQQPGDVQRPQVGRAREVARRVTHTPHPAVRRVAPRVAHEVARQDWSLYGLEQERRDLEALFGAVSGGSAALGGPTGNPAGAAATTGVAGEAAHV